MSTSKKSAATIRQGGPGASRENAKEPLDIQKPAAEPDKRRQSKVSTRGGSEGQTGGGLTSRRDEVRRFIGST